jgi:hypothetical protein
MRRTLMAIVVIAGVCAFAFAAPVGVSGVTAAKPLPAGAPGTAPAFSAAGPAPQLPPMEPADEVNKKPHQGPPLKDGTDGLSTSYLYYKGYYSSYLWRTDKTCANATTERSASWQTSCYNALATLTPDGSTIIEYEGCGPYIRKTDAASGSYTDMYTGYDLCGGAAGCDQNYV